MNNFCILYVTTKDAAQAKQIGEILVAEKLVACANILPSMHSIYRWENKITHDEESVLLLKTRRDLVVKIEAKIREHHTYSVPCILQLPIVGANADYLVWLQQQLDA